MRIISEGNPTMKRMPLLAQVIVCDHCGCAFEYTLLDVYSRDKKGITKQSTKNLFIVRGVAKRLNLYRAH